MKTKVAASPPMIKAVTTITAVTVLDHLQQATPPSKDQQPQPKALPEKIVPAPQNIKESNHIYVFIGWMWAAIAVLIYFLRLKIKETDRLYFSRFFSPDKKG